MTTFTVAPRAPARSEAKPLRPPDRLALEITGRDYVSHSQLSLMRACPKKFAFRYIEEAPADFVPVSLVYGGAIHAGIEAYYRARLEGWSLSAEGMLKAYHSAWQQTVESAGSHVPVKYGVKEDESSVHALAKRTIDAFLASPLANPKGIVIGVEEEQRIVLHPDLPSVLTRVDLITATDTALHITDFKTARSKWTPEKAEEASDQLLLYASASTGLATSMNLPVKLTFAVLTKAKSPLVQVLPVPAAPERARAVTQSALQTWSAIVAGNFYPNPTPMNCTTCPYKRHCPVFAGRSASALN